MFKGVSNWAPYWEGGFKLGTLLAVSFWGGGGFQIGHPIGSLILGREEGFELGTLLAVSFWGGRGVSNWVPYWQFHFGTAVG